MKRRIQRLEPKAPQHKRQRKVGLAALKIALFAASCLCTLLNSAEWVAGQSNTPLEPHVTPNYRQAAQYSSSYVRQFLYDTTLRPNWIGETDRFWYTFRNSQGTHYYLVDPKKETKEPLFDRVRLGGQLGEMIRKPVDPKALPISQVRLNDEATELTFSAEKRFFKYSLSDETLEETEKSDTPEQPEMPRGFRGTREQFQRDDAQPRPWQ